MEIRGLFLDLDGTLVRYEQTEYHSGWNALGYALGLEEAWEKVMAYYLPQPEKYSEWFEANLGMLKGGRYDQKVREILFPDGSAPYSPGVRDFFDWLNALPQRRDFVTGVVSSGINLVADQVKNDLSLEFAIANRLVLVNTDKGLIFNGQGEELVPVTKKKEVVEKVISEYELSLGEICFVGDYVNDIPVLESVGLPIAFNPKDKRLESIAHHVIYDFKKLKEILERIFQD